jgi:hypothetical protein
LEATLGEDVEVAVKVEEVLVEVDEVLVEVEEVLAEVVVEVLVVVGKSWD